MSMSSMNISVSGQGIELGHSLIEYTEKRVEHHISKHLPEVQSTRVVVSHDGKWFCTECNLILPDGTAVHSSSDSNGNFRDAQHSVEDALASLEKQIRRLHRKSKSH